MINKNRVLYLLKYLWRNTDEDHPATTAELLSALEADGVSVNRHTVVKDIGQLQEFGIDVICTKSSPNKYFIGARTLELPELKLLVDAVESSRFISEKKSNELVKKLYALASTYQAAELDRHLYIDGRVKSDNKTLLYTVDLLHKAIHTGRRIRFQYIEYTADKMKTYKHGGYVYEFSPYALLWHDDCYYALGYSEKHKGIAKFRVDRIGRAELTETLSVNKPENFQPSAYLKNIFSMYDGEMQTVHLKCDTDMMKVIVDRFGKDVRTTRCENGSFTAEVQVSVSPTFFSWVFGFGGKIRIAYPESLVAEYRKALLSALKDDV